MRMFVPIVLRYRTNLSYVLSQKREYCVVLSQTNIYEGQDPGTLMDTVPPLFATRASPSQYLDDLYNRRRANRQLVLCFRCSDVIFCHRYSICLDFLKQFVLKYTTSIICCIVYIILKFSIISVCLFSRNPFFAAWFTSIPY